MTVLQPIGSILPPLTNGAAQERQDSCERHGDFTSRNPIGRVWTRCPTCAAEVKAAAEAEQRAIDERLNADRNRTAWLSAIGDSGIPLRFQSRSLKDYRAETTGQQTALAFAESYAAEFEGEHSGRCAVFLGDIGTGKTHLACGIALRIMHRFNRTAVFTTLEEMARRIREAKSFSSNQNESATIALYTYPDLLIIDEVGIQSGTDTEARSLFAVVNGRYEARKPSLFLSNLDREGIADCLGPRLYDRLKEDGCEVLVFDWDSYRAREAA